MLVSILGPLIYNKDHSMLVSILGPLSLANSYSFMARFEFCTAASQDSKPDAPVDSDGFAKGACLKQTATLIKKWLYSRPSEPLTYRWAGLG